MLGVILMISAVLAMSDDEPGKKDPFQKAFHSPKEAMEAMTAREPKAPKVGDVAPDFELPSVDGKTRVRLSSFKGKAPVVLLFGSYT
ncbi:MAG: redoxin domain-containing protein [Planctomycetes bacterium]|nr:redoxin domain-containing protein [Planctomycetota bacterium]